MSGLIGQGFETPQKTANATNRLVNDTFTGLHPKPALALSVVAVPRG
jgi:hypothetical protein